MSREDLRVVERRSGVFQITIDRPHKHNSMTVAMRARIGNLIAEIGRDPATRVLILRGAGDRAFSAGGDVAEFLRLTPAELLHWGEELGMPERVPVPVIAAIDGYCLGAGFELALSCDYRVATPKSVFGLPELRLGMMPGSGGSQRLIRLAGLARGREMLLRGRRIDAATALTYGLVSEVVAEETLTAAVDELAEELAGFSKTAMTALKQVVNQSLDVSIEAGCELERKAYALLRATPDYEEGVRAFLDRRPAVFAR